MQQPFTSRDVVSLTGITPRQLQWWDERRIVVPAREGRRRMYSMEDLAEVAVICELRRRGFSLQRVRKVMRFLQREFGKPGRDRQRRLRISPAHRRQNSLSGNFTPADCGHLEKRAAAHADDLY